MRSCQHRDEAVVELVVGTVLDRFLLDVHLLATGTKQVQLLHFQPDGGQARTGGEMGRRFCDRFLHNDDPPIVDSNFLNRYGSSSFF